MASSTLIVLELILVFGVVFGWGLWELWSLKRDKERSRQKEAEKDPD